MTADEWLAGLRNAVDEGGLVKVAGSVRIIVTMDTGHEMTGIADLWIATGPPHLRLDKRFMVSGEAMVGRIDFQEPAVWLREQLREVWADLFTRTLVVMPPGPLRGGGG